MSPGWTLLQPLDQDFIVTGERQVMKMAEITTFDTGFQIGGHPQACPKERNRAAGLPNILAHSESGIEEGLVVMIGRVEFRSPQDVSI